MRHLWFFSVGTAILIAFALATVGSAQIDQSNVGGDAQYTGDPPLATASNPYNIREGNHQSDTVAIVFNERQAERLSNALLVDDRLTAGSGVARTYNDICDFPHDSGDVPPNCNPTGESIADRTCIDSHFLHADPVNPSGNPNQGGPVYSGDFSVRSSLSWDPTYDSEIIGVIAIEGRLDSSDNYPGLTHVLYHNSNDPDDHQRDVEFSPNTNMDSLAIGSAHRRVDFFLHVPAYMDQARFISLERCRPPDANGPYGGYFGDAVQLQGIAKNQDNSTAGSDPERVVQWTIQSSPAGVTCDLDPATPAIDATSPLLNAQVKCVHDSPCAQASVTLRLNETSNGLSDDEDDTAALLLSCRPTAVELRSVIARVEHGGVMVRWRTGAEFQTLGFNVYRQERGALVKLNRALIPSGGTPTGHAYSWLDRRARSFRGTLRYRLQTVNLDATRRWIGATTVRRAGTTSR